MRTETKLLKPLLQVLAVSLSLFVGWSRIADNKHFLTDVLAGFVLGAIQFCMVFGESSPAFAVIKTDITSLAQGKFAHALYTQISTARLYEALGTTLKIFHDSLHRNSRIDLSTEDDQTKYGNRQDFSAGGGWRVTGDGWRVTGGR